MASVSAAPLLPSMSSNDGVTLDSLIASKRSSAPRSHVSRPARSNAKATSRLAPVVGGGRASSSDGQWKHDKYEGAAGNKTLAGRVTKAGKASAPVSASGSGVFGRLENVKRGGASSQATAAPSGRTKQAAELLAATAQASAVPLPKAAATTTQTTVSVSNLMPGTTSADLQELFAGMACTSFRMLSPTEGCVLFASRDHALNAVKQYDGLNVNNSRISVALLMGVASAISQPKMRSQVVAPAHTQQQQQQQIERYELMFNIAALLTRTKGPRALFAFSPPAAPRKRGTALPFSVCSAITWVSRALADQ
mgnify:CR=1 FL=1